MKFTMTKIAGTLALTMAASGAHAAAVTGLTLADTIDASNYSGGILGTDGKSGALRFGPINPTTYYGASLFAGDINGGVIDVAAPNAAGSFSSPFVWAGAAFTLYTTGPIDMDITGGVLTVNSLPWAAHYAGTDYGPVSFNNLSPDPGTLWVLNLIQTGTDTYAYRIGWSHTITTADDSTGAYIGFTTRWMLEGTMTTVPEPETYAMLATGLGLVRAAARRRRKQG